MATIVINSILDADGNPVTLAGSGIITGVRSDGEPDITVTPNPDGTWSFDFTATQPGNCVISFMYGDVKITEYVMKFVDDVTVIILPRTTAEVLQGTNGLIACQITDDEGTVIPNVPVQFFEPVQGSEPLETLTTNSLGEVEWTVSSINGVGEESLGARNFEIVAAQQTVVQSITWIVTIPEFAKLNVLWHSSTSVNPGQLTSLASGAYTSGWDGVGGVPIELWDDNNNVKVSEGTTDVGGEFYYERFEGQSINDPNLAPDKYSVKVGDEYNTHWVYRNIEYPIADTWVDVVAPDVIPAGKTAYLTAKALERNGNPSVEDSMMAWIAGEATTDGWSTAFYKGEAGLRLPVLPVGTHKLVIHEYTYGGAFLPIEVTVSDQVTPSVASGIVIDENHSTRFAAASHSVPIIGHLLDENGDVLKPNWMLNLKAKNLATGSSYAFKVKPDGTFEVNVRGTNEGANNIEFYDADTNVVLGEVYAFEVKSNMVAELSACATIRPVSGEPATLIARAVDSGGNPVKGAYVQIKNVGNKYDVYDEGITDENGYIEVKLYDYKLYPSMTFQTRFKSTYGAVQIPVGWAQEGELTASQFTNLSIPEGVPPGTEFTFTGKIADQNGDPYPGSQVIVLDKKEGVEVSATVQADGTFSATLTPTVEGPHPLVIAGNGVIARHELNVSNPKLDVLDNSPTWVGAGIDGNIYAAVVESDGTPVPNTTIDFYASTYDSSPTQTIVTDETGIAHFVIPAEDPVWGGINLGEYTYKLGWGSETKLWRITWHEVEGPLYQIWEAPYSTKRGSYGATSEIIAASARSASGFPMPGETLTLHERDTDALLGTAVTDQYGYAEFTISSPTSDPEDQTVSTYEYYVFKSGDESISLEVDLRRDKWLTTVPGGIENIQVPTEIPVGKKVMIGADLLDVYGKPLPNPVGFSTWSKEQDESLFGLGSGTSGLYNHALTLVNTNNLPVGTHSLILYGGLSNGPLAEIELNISDTVVASEMGNIVFDGNNPTVARKNQKFTIWGRALDVNGDPIEINHYSRVSGKHTVEGRGSYGRVNPDGTFTMQLDTYTLGTAVYEFHDYVHEDGWVFPQTFSIEIRDDILADMTDGPALNPAYGETVTLTARVLDDLGNPVAGVMVPFIDWATGKQWGHGISDADGYASFDLIHREQYTSIEFYTKLSSTTASVNRTTVTWADPV
ncbi:hypothetical protein [Vibrio phage phiKT1028]|nr:hypothetical protein [Vibrio phage phiKT1028]